MNAPEHGQVTFGSTVVRYTIVRSARRKKTVEVQIDGDRHIRIAAPVTATNRKLELLLRQRSHWIITRLKRDSGHTSSHEFVNGETFLYLGRQAKLRIIEVKRPANCGVKLVRGRLEVRIAPTTRTGDRQHRVRQLLERWYRDRGATKLLQRVELYAARLGVEPSAVVVRDQATRWGSCSKDGVLRFNWRIIMAPISLVDYVVVHELSHLFGASEHGNGFWSVVGRTLPDYERRRVALRTRGSEFGWL